MVFSGFVTAWRLAIWPTSFSSDSLNAEWHGAINRTYNSVVSRTKQAADYGPVLAGTLPPLVAVGEPPPFTVFSDGWASGVMPENVERARSEGRAGGVN